MTGDGQEKCCASSCRSGFTDRAEAGPTVDGECLASKDGKGLQDRSDVASIPAGHSSPVTRHRPREPLRIVPWVRLQPDRWR